MQGYVNPYSAFQPGFNYNFQAIPGYSPPAQVYPQVPQFMTPSYSQSQNLQTYPEINPMVSAQLRGASQLPQMYGYNPAPPQLAPMYQYADALNLLSSNQPYPGLIQPSQSLSFPYDGAGFSYIPQLLTQNAAMPGFALPKGTVPFAAPAYAESPHVFDPQILHNPPGAQLVRQDQTNQQFTGSDLTQLAQMYPDTFTLSSEPVQGVSGQDIVQDSIPIVQGSGMSQLAKLFGYTEGIALLNARAQMKETPSVIETPRKVFIRGPSPAYAQLNPQSAHMETSDMAQLPSTPQPSSLRPQLYEGSPVRYDELEPLQKEVNILQPSPPAPILKEPPEVSNLPQVSPKRPETNDPSPSANVQSTTQSSVPITEPVPITSVEQLPKHPVSNAAEDMNVPQTNTPLPSEYAQSAVPNYVQSTESQPKTSLEQLPNQPPQPDLNVPSESINLPQQSPQNPQSKNPVSSEYIQSNVLNYVLITEPEPIISYEQPEQHTVPQQAAQEAPQDANQPNEIHAPEQTNQEQQAPALTQQGSPVALRHAPISPQDKPLGEKGLVKKGLESGNFSPGIMNQVNGGSLGERAMLKKGLEDASEMSPGLMAQTAGESSEVGVQILGERGMLKKGIEDVSQVSPGLAAQMNNIQRGFF